MLYGIATSIDRDVTVRDHLGRYGGTIADYGHFAGRSMTGYFSTRVHVTSNGLAQLLPMISAQSCYVGRYLE
jgi:hypothetical protein